MYYIYDLETYPNLFSMAIVREDGKQAVTFEISEFHNDIERFYNCLQYLKDNKHCLVGFNNLGFDYPIVHKLLLDKDKLIKKTGKAIAKHVFNLAQQQIQSAREGGFADTVKLEDRLIPQLDLYKVWHFDNKAKATSLKMLEFNMRAESIEDLPFPFSSTLTKEQVQKVLQYNAHDVAMTLRFFNESRSQITFREQLTAKYNRDFMNHNDSKIGGDYFAMRLEEADIKTYEFKNGKRVMKQSRRKQINIAECLFDYYDFKRPEFIAVVNWFKQQVITETKGVFSDIEEHLLGDVAQYATLTTKRKKFKNKPSQEEIDEFKNEHPLGWIEEEELAATEYLFDEEGNHILIPVLDEFGNVNPKRKPKKARVHKKSYWGCWRIAETLNVVVDGFRFDFGTGGIHGSLESKVIRANKAWKLIDADVGSMYPNIAISNRVYPEHLGEEFCEIYEDVYNQRKSYAKGTPENAMLKLGLNGTYGNSNNEYSIFYDPKYTMTITINGQLSLCLLAEKLLATGYVKIAQVNTDGITVALRRDAEDVYHQVCNDWEKQVGLQLEYADYSKMYIRDVNNYIAVYTDGKVKRKGAYQYEGLGWHQNQSALVVQKAAEYVMVEGGDLLEYIKSNTDPFDFMLRTKVPRSSSLVLVVNDQDYPQQNICRYYPSTSFSAGQLIKIMPPLEEGDEDRRIGIDTGYMVKICNHMVDFSFDDLDYQYYVEEAKKLIIE